MNICYQKRMQTRNGRLHCPAIWQRARTRRFRAHADVFAERIAEETPLSRTRRGRVDALHRRRDGVDSASLKGWRHEDVDQFHVNLPHQRLFVAFDHGGKARSADGGECSGRHRGEDFRALKRAAWRCTTWT